MTELALTWWPAALVAAVPGFLALRFAWRRARTLRALALTPPASRLLSRLVGSFSYRGDDFYSADGVDETWVARRRVGLEALARRLEAQSPRSIAWGDSIRESFSDLRFADANRVPFPFGEKMRELFNLSAVVVESRGPHLCDLDGNWTLDAGGSYGVNLAGYDRYKTFMERGFEKVRDLGPVLGPLHPLVGENIRALQQISGLDEVSFHTSGTEAVMAAVRLARFNTRREKIVCFSGAYHGWWDGVQPGLGSERALGDCLALTEMSSASLAAIRARASEIAAVLVNPVQLFHPNVPPPNDAVLLTSEVRKTEGQSESQKRSYGEWLAALRAVCTELDVPLVFDEVYSGFRLAPAGAQEFFGVQADMVVYGKSVAGGMPVGAVCGRRELMRRFDPDHPMRIAYVIGTFAAHPVVMGAMNEFLSWVTTEEAVREHREAIERCAQWEEVTNKELAAAGLPVRVARMTTIWTLLFEEPGRYNWLLQYYLRAEGLTLSWVGTGRCLCSMDYTDEDYAELRKKVVDAACEMRNDGWWPTEAEHPGRSRWMRFHLVREMVGSLIRVPKPVKAFVAEVMQRKHDDHHASHSDPTNQGLHVISSTAFLACYALAFSNLTLAMWIGLAALLVRQFGHAVLEPPCHDEEKLLLGFTTRAKTAIVAVYTGILLLPFLQADFSLATFESSAGTIATHWFVFTLLLVFGRVAVLSRRHGFRNAAIWWVKLVTDPATDIVAYTPRPSFGSSSS